MAPVLTDFDDLVAAWPAPVRLTHLEGDLFVTLSLHADYIEAKWAGHITADDVITAAQVFLLLLQKTAVPKLLNNKTDASGDWSEANDWLEFEWLPKALEAGFHRLAHVYSNNMFSRLSARDLYLRLGPRISMRTFSDREAAEAWLLSAPTAQDAQEPVADQ
ncbi:STAS/SEC14 domain-containing protein [Pontibacter russatus]|uniref:STAS/SEC14 domain-containing protein n=1 Tax=Pontibacter russatus TaxID=2694929 RepID=UPI001F458A94|nr:STAS/SEC14 domain-containing protein [Pontibacter russatus]